MNIVNPNGGNGTMVVTLPGVKASDAARIESLAFAHGKSGVGHIFFNPKRHAQDGNVRVWRNPVSGDPGQPIGWSGLAPFTTGGLADHIKTLTRLSAAAKPGEFVQALVFQVVAEGLAFQSAMAGVEA